MTAELDTVSAAPLGPLRGRSPVEAYDEAGPDPPEGGAGPVAVVDVGGCLRPHSRGGASRRGRGRAGGSGAQEVFYFGIGARDGTRRKEGGGPWVRRVRTGEDLDCTRGGGRRVGSLTGRGSGVGEGGLLCPRPWGPWKREGVWVLGPGRGEFRVLWRHSVDLDLEVCEDPSWT